VLQEQRSLCVHVFVVAHVYAFVGACTHVYMCMHVRDYGKCQLYYRKKLRFRAMLVPDDISTNRWLNVNVYCILLLLYIYYI